MGRSIYPPWRGKRIPIAVVARHPPPLLRTRCHHHHEKWRSARPPPFCTYRLMTRLPGGVHCSLTRPREPIPLMHEDDCPEPTSRFLKLKSRKIRLTQQFPLSELPGTRCAGCSMDVYHRVIHRSCRRQKTYPPGTRTAAAAVRMHDDAVNARKSMRVLLRLFVHSKSVE